MCKNSATARGVKIAGKMVDKVGDIIRRGVIDLIIFSSCQRHANGDAHICWWSIHNLSSIPMPQVQAHRATNRLLPRPSSMLRVTIVPARTGNLPRQV